MEVQEDEERAIQRQRLETLSIDEYQRLKQRAIEKQDRYVPLFMASRERINHVLNARRLFRMYFGSTAAANVLTLVTPIATKAKMLMGTTSVLYGMLGFSNFITIALFYALNSSIQHVTLAIEWDTEEELYIVRCPKNIFSGSINRKVKHENFQ